MSNASVQGWNIQYGSAFLFVKPVGGNQANNPMPVFPLTVQDVELSIKGKIDELRGQFQWPDDVAQGDKTGTGKFGIGRKDWYLFNQIYFGGAASTGGSSVSPLEPHTVPASSTFTVTVVPPGSGTFAEDLGVMYASNGYRLQIAASLTEAGQYTVSDEGLYTFYSGDASANVIISYRYNVTTGNTYPVQNQYMGYGPTCEFLIVDSYVPSDQPSQGGVIPTIWLPAVKVSSLGNVGNKRDKYAMPEVEFTIFANAAGQVVLPFLPLG